VRTGMGCVDGGDDLDKRRALIASVLDRVVIAPSLRGVARRPMADPVAAEARIPAVMEARVRPEWHG
jgi:hypothetical protein